MRVGILGSGKVGRALGSWAASLGEVVIFASRDPEHAADAAQKAGNGAKAATLAELAADSELLLLTLPFREVRQALQSAGAGLNGKIIVDVTNPITTDRQALELGHTTSGAEEIARQFPATRVVKAFNATFAEIYEARRPAIAGHRITIFFAGDDANAKKMVKQLIHRLGFDAVDAGPLLSARCLEPLSLLNIRLGRFLGFGTDIGFSMLRHS